MQLDFFGDATSYMDQMKANWRATIEGDGGHCPCCGKWGKISPQGMNETRALALLWLSRAPSDDDGWVDVPDRKSTRLNSSHMSESRMPSSA